MPLKTLICSDRFKTKSFLLRSSGQTMQVQGTNLPDNHIGVTDAYDTFYGGFNYGVIRPRKTVENRGDYSNWNSFGDFGADRNTVDDEDSGVSSPPPGRTCTPLQRSRSLNRTLSPTSRAQAIARGQRELMEMVSRMPEGCYELSLKDIVEQPMVDAKEESFIQERSIINEDVWPRGEQEKRRKDRNTVQLNRKASTKNNGGLLLKMVFPFSWGSSKKKSSVSALSDVVKDGRVSPKPLLYEASVETADQNWWKKRDSEEGEESTESGGFSSNSGSSKCQKSSNSSSSGRSSSSSSRHGTCGCWCFIFPRGARQRNK